MLKKLVVIFIFLIIFNFSYPVTTLGVDSSAKSAILIEEKTGRVLYSKNNQEPLPMASTTKIMTAIVAIEYGDLDEEVIIDDKTSYIEGSSIYLKENDSIKLLDLLYGLMLRSGNDAAYAIANHVAGSEENFITLMNEKAKIIGATQTNFTNPHGLHDENHYTTAKDLALITQYAFKNEIFKEIVQSTKREIVVNNGKRLIFNKNRLVTEYTGGNGVKTGYTTDAGKCLVFSAQRDDLQLVGVLIDSYNIWTDSEILLDFGFENFKLQNVLKNNEYIGSVYVEDGINDILKIISNENISIPITEDEEISEVVNLNKSLKAPIFNKQQIGSIEYFIDDELVYQKPLYAHQKVYEKNYIKFLYENIQQFLRNILVN